jgi:hypothetical protein
VKKLWTYISGRKTYAVSLAMIGIGTWFFTAEFAVSWDSPTPELADLRAIVRQAVGWVLMTQGVAIATLRHAIGTTPTTSRHPGAVSTPQHTIERLR